MTEPALQRASLAPYDSYPIYELLRRTARRLPNTIAVIDGERSFTYRQLDDNSDRLAAALVRLGVRKGDTIGILAPNCVEFEIAFFGITKAGAIATPLNSGYREREIAHQLKNSGAKMLVVHENLVKMAQIARDHAPRLMRLIVMKETSIDPESFWGMIENESPTPPSMSIDPKEDLAALPYSSGTTGISKGVMLTHFNLASNVRQLLDRTDEATRMMEGEAILVHLPLFHIYGLQVLMNGCIGAGATQILMDRFDMQSFLGSLSRHKVAGLFTVPPVGLSLAQDSSVGQYDLSSLRLGFFGAAPLSADMQSRIQETLGVPIVQAYGLTEAGPLTHCDYVEPDRSRVGSVGPPMPDTEQRVVDLEDSDKDVLSGNIGELLVRGPQVMKGYLGEAEASAEIITREGWLHTGDIVRVDADGYAWILDRKKELIKYKGFQVPPAELEGLLLEHPAVSDAAVIGKPDPEAGEIPKAFVVQREDMEVSAEELMRFISEKVSTAKKVRELEFVDNIPKNASGKIMRRLLMEVERSKSIS